jgi:hypothetical protein
MTRPNQSRPWPVADIADNCKRACRKQLGAAHFGLV